MGDAFATEIVHQWVIEDDVKSLSITRPTVTYATLPQALLSRPLVMFAAGVCSSAYVAPKAAVLSLANALRLEVP